MQATDHAPSTSVSPTGAIVTMLYEPTATFRRLQPRPRAWIPLLLLMATSLVIALWYFSIVDFAWLLDQMLAAIKSADEREKAAAFMSKTVMQVSSLIGAVLGYPVYTAIVGVYLMIASKALAHGLSFGKGFALAAWSSVPYLLLFPLGAMQILLASSGQLAWSELNPLSLNQLLFHYDMAHPLASFMDALSVPTIWSIVLLTIGLETWASVKRSTALMVVLIPHILVFGVWFAYAMSKTA